MLEIFDPRSWNITYEQYEYGWHLLVNTLFKGIWAKIIASLALIMSVYAVIRRKFKPIVWLLCFSVAVVFAYAGTIIGWFS